MQQALEIGEIVEIRKKNLKQYGIIDSITATGKTARVKVLPGYFKANVPAKDICRLRLPYTVRKGVIDILLLSHSVSLAWCELGSSQEELVRSKIFSAAEQKIKEIIEKQSERSSRRKVLISSRNREVIIITDANPEYVKNWCKNRYLQETDGLFFENTLFSSLTEQFYVKVLYDSELDGNENVEVIGYDEEYSVKDYSD